MKIKPINDLVIIQEEKTEEKTVSGIYAARIAPEAPDRGKIIACGEKCEFVKKGDNVIYRRYGGDEIKTDEKKFIVMKEENILGILT